MNTESELYRPEMTDTINAVRGRVYLDTSCPRVCIRGPENRAQADLGYSFLPEEDIYAFYELRSAADDLRGGHAYDPVSMRQKIAAQLDTLTDASVRHVVLSAFGCGAFGNPALEVAKMYKEEIEKREGCFDCIAFGIFHAGYGPDNFSPFKEVFQQQQPNEPSGGPTMPPATIRTSGSRQVNGSGGGSCSIT